MSHKLVSQYRTGRKEGRKDRETERQSNRKGEKGRESTLPERVTTMGQGSSLMVMIKGRSRRFELNWSAIE